ncbi:MAG: hypothetical protein A3H69_04520 [Candidatus Sungbacteria bacterium RIFCSPLOWO2_02_FULL_47_9]|uniref:Aminoacyl-tRNA hydrolase n=1 Tax=Candidatus Sungbacteria bacterium RIFCSPHIGHO2_01_FULL_47_32 TaxID=1802264 RepID=A0A1G2K9X7_9BACT|nr:MAG: peptidyl-tRNA hydrolase [Parcubacteria group bacterium GW2011_GWA2_47_10]OGZ95270.1 MAG: hypothetical protein A2633_06120 [Candidatus Sungbacteria bacterium RIFCSPHIGHO2_01_FULL_47_32]OGZ97992.1 MAG: hypothetical protein A3D57_02630 [Candidatus Sungbacteria bacterium RIFCSPHIGHO2_02_FULL_46_12]OHA06227.1 MAG: hypothetical protein A3A28_00135 [Candidatus Sungbacteria bacterium RIFCSPLOWO2_01_FULL_47_32]OHA11394.1 MAG: hypothetical protein A3H69_04520 [Candidatus Sungbacteria bacterium RI
MYLLIGLGNPGKEYEGTRHNVGRETLLWWQKAADLAAFEFDKKANALISRNKKTALALPETFMNNSGRAMAVLVKYFKVKPEHVVVLHDDADIEFGNTKLSFNRSAAGHRGVESVRRALKTEKFWRVRIGIQKHKRVDAMKLVLQKFKGDEGCEMKKIMKKIGEGLELLLSDGPAHAMNFINQN